MKSVDGVNCSAGASYSASEKIIRLVEESPLPVRYTLAKFGITGQPSTAGAIGTVAAGQRL
jgi:hypothetical protein